MNVVPVEYRGCLSPKPFKLTYVENSMDRVHNVEMARAIFKSEDKNLAGSIVGS